MDFIVNVIIVLLLLTIVRNVIVIFQLYQSNKQLDKDIKKVEAILKQLEEDDERLSK